MITIATKTLIRHEGELPRERSTCGWWDRLISREDSGVAAWAHAVDIDGAREHYHKRSTANGRISGKGSGTVSCSRRTRSQTASDI